MFGSCDLAAKFFNSFELVVEVLCGHPSDVFESW